jgi:hypothetical protein
MEERGVNVDHATLNRWVIRYSDLRQNQQDHRFIKKITKPMMGFKAFHSAQATIAGIENGAIYTERLIVTVIRLISCCLSVVMKRLQQPFSNKLLTIRHISIIVAKLA